jgi:flagellar biosynthetic protein FliR
MIELAPGLVDLVTLSQEAFQQAAIVFLRIGAMMAVLPAFGEQAVPVRVRLALALAFTAIVAPIRIGQGFPILPAFHRALLTETLIGLALGMSLRLFVIALQTAAAMIAQAMSLAQLFAGAGAEPQPAVGHLMTVAGLALALATGLPVHIVELLLLSYGLLPVGESPAAGEMVDWGVAQVGRSFALGFSIAAPFVIAGLLYNLALGVMNRAMPQLMLTLVGAPALALGGLALAAIALPLGLASWLEALRLFLASPFGAPP